MEKKKCLIKMVYGILSVFILSVVLISCGKNSAERWQEQYDLGMRYLEEQNYEEAIVAFTAAIEIDPNYADAYTGRGNAYVFSGETEEHLAQALADYQKALELDEANAAAYLGIADIYIRQGDYEAALEILNEGLEKTGGNEEIAAKIEEVESGNVTDSSGNIRRRSSYDGTGALIWYQEFTYNPDGTMAAAASYDGSGNQTGHVDLEYREDGKQLTGYQYSTDGGEIGPIKREYDEAGNCTREDWYDETESLIFYLENRKIQFYSTNLFLLRNYLN